MRRPIIWLLIAMAGVMPSMAATNYVYPGGNDTYAGTNWATAWRTVTTALARANAGDQVWVAAGTYSPGGNTTDSINLKSEVGLYGGFTNGMTAFNQRDWTNNATVLDGSNVNWHVVKSAGKTNAVLDGFTIMRGKANGAYPDYCGGGVWISGGVPLIYNCLFTNNTANNGAGAGRGGAVFTEGVTDPNAAFSNCLFIANNAQEGGGALYPNSQYPAFRRCVFRNNTCTAGFLYGGAAFVINGTFENCEFISNGTSANGQGGAISSGWGVRIDIVNCAFAGNVASIGGAVDIYHNNAARIVNCSFGNNWASAQGGALNVMDGASVVVTNCIMWGNSAPSGPEIFNSSVLSVAYSDVFGGWPGTSNLDANPLFAAIDDLHLLSRGGRWTPYGGEIDQSDSPCLDMGDPGLPYAAEPAPNGGRINIGAYGNTEQASRSATLRVAASDGDFTDRVRVAWDRDGGAAGYELRRGTTGNYEAASTIWSGAALSYDDTTADAATNYYYWVRGTNGAGATSRWGGDDGRRGTIYYVRTDGSDGADGSNWANAFATVTNALARAVVGGRIWVAAGIYSPGPNSSDTIDLKSYVGLYGGFTNGMASFQERDPSANATILDGSNVNSHVLRCANARFAILDGFTVQRGYANAAYPDMYGGGIAIFGGLPQIFNCIFTNNSAPKSTSPCGRGGAFFVNYMSVMDPASTFSNCVFAANTACEAGGAGFLYNPFPVFRKCVFSNNRVTTYPYGGALYAQYGTFRSCAFLANGTASSPATQGGAICAGWGRLVECYNCYFISNSAAYGGAILVYHSGQNIRLANCSFSRNSAANEGGAIHMYNDGTTLIAADIANSILWDDSAPVNPEIRVAVGSVTVSYSDVQGGYAGTSNLDVNPLYASPGNDLHLQSLYGRWTGAGWFRDTNHSPCIDAGNPLYDYSFEQRPNGYRLNMGAFGNTPEASKSGLLQGLVIFAR